MLFEERDDVVEAGAAYEFGDGKLVAELLGDLASQVECLQGVHAQRDQRAGGVDGVDVGGADHVGDHRQRCGT